ncbi:hypothetical protein PS421_09055 [Pediococcus pentosaceus]|uniref:hypothetical protein n=1 Tax=Pediococcus pentosaceus TaxID=1255 RepID=UPI002F266672
MTKDELDMILKKDGMYLSSAYDGTFSNGFFVVNDGCVVIEFNGVDFIFSRDYKHRYGKKIVAALIEYVNTPVEERKPKPQLYNIIIAKGTDRDGFYLTAWQKESGSREYYVNSCIVQYDLLHDNDFKFTVEEIEDLKSKVSEKQKQIIDIGMVKVEETTPEKVYTTNEYEVEEQKKYRVRVKGISTNQKNLLRYHTSLKTFELAGVSTNAKNFKTEFTKQWLKDNWIGFNTYNNAGLLEFEEIDGD